MGTSATGPTGPTAPTLGSASGSDVANMARTQALPGASMPSQPPAMQTGPNSWVPVAPSSAPSAMTSRPSGSYLPPYVDGPPVTQPSSISVSQSAVPGSDSSTKPVLAALAGVTVGLVLLGGALYLKQKPPAGPTASTGVVTTAPTGAGPQAPPGTGAESPPTTPGATVIRGPMPTTAAGTPTAMTPTPIVPGPVTPVAPTTAKPRIVKPSASPASAPKPAADDCNPDFTIGADGVKRFKPQCLK